MIHKLTILFLFFSVLIHAQTQQISGKYITASNDTIDCTFHAKTVSKPSSCNCDSEMERSINFAGMQSKIKAIDYNTGKELIITPKSHKGFIITYNGKKHVFINPNVYFTSYKCIIPTKQKIFLELVSERNYYSTYLLHKKAFAGQFYNRRNPQYSLSYQKATPVIIGNKGETFKFKSFNFKRLSLSAFKDNSFLCTKIRTKEYKYKDLPQIVEQYNKWKQEQKN